MFTPAITKTPVARGRLSIGITALPQTCQSCASGAISSLAISRFWIFQDGGSHNLGYLKFYIFNDPNGQEGRTASLRHILSKSLKPRRRYVSFRFFQDGGRPPSWICNACVGTTHEWHLVVFITVQNLVGIDAVVSITCTFFDFTSLA